MSQEHFLEGRDWPLRSRRRRLRIGDFMVAVAMTAIGFSAVGLPDLTVGGRLFLAAAALVFPGLQWIQWGLASVSAKGAWPGLTLSMGVLSAVLALAMFVMLIILGLAFPGGAALLSVTILIQVVYLTTWD